MTTALLRRGGGAAAALASLTAQYNTSPATRTAGQTSTLEQDVNGNLRTADQFAPVAEDNTNGVLATQVKPLATATYSPSLHTNFGAATKANIKASAGNVFSLVVTNANAAARFVQIHNKATAPAATEVPILSFAVPAGTAAAPAVLKIGTETLTQAGLNFATGIGWAISTTIGTFTDAATAAEHAIHVLYK